MKVMEDIKFPVQVGPKNFPSVLKFTRNSLMQKVFLVSTDMNTTVRDVSIGTTVRKLLREKDFF